MALQAEVLTKIKEEITNDPENMGYAGKTDAEIKDLLNSSYEKDVVVTTKMPARIHEIVIGIADTPNIIAESDVTAAKLS